MIINLYIINTISWLGLMLEIILNSTIFKLIVGLASIATVGISIFVLINLSEIRKNYYLKNRLPKLIKKLSFYTSEINRNLPEGYDDNSLVNPTIDLSINQSISIIEKLIPKLPRHEKTRAKNLNSLIKKHCRNFWGRYKKIKYRQAWEIYVQISSFMVSLDVLHKDIKEGEHDE